MCSNLDENKVTMDKQGMRGKKRNYRRKEGTENATKYLKI